MNKAKKRIMSLVLVFILITSINVIVNAEGIGASLVALGLKDIGVTLGVSGGATLATFLPWLNNGYSVSGAFTGIADGYIKISGDTTYIDGVAHQKVWIDPSFAQSLHTQLFDFNTQYNIVSNTSGIIANGIGYYGGIGVYNINNVIRTQSWNINALGTFSVGNIGLSVRKSSGDYYLVDVVYPDGITERQVNGSQKLPLEQFIFKDSQNRWYRRSTAISGSPLIYDFLLNSSYYIENAFEYDYVSQNIDATPLTENEGFKLYIPENTVIQAGIQAGTYTNDAGSGLATILQILQMLDEAYKDELVKQAEFAEDVEPVPPPTYDTISDTSYEVLHNELVQIKNAQAQENANTDLIGQSVENIEDTVDLIGQSASSIDYTLTDIEGRLANMHTDTIDILEDISDVIGTQTDTLEGAIDILGQTASSIDSTLTDIEGQLVTDHTETIESIEDATQAIEAVESAVEAQTTSITSSIAEVLEQVITHPLDLFGSMLDGITEIFSVTFQNIKRHLGIWHYVVEWLASIGAIFSFYFGVMNGTSYYMVLPIYAAIAGAICLALYKRFGR